MAKTIVKETILMLLLTIAIVLILGVLLYEYIPSNKVVPDKERVAYTRPENIAAEINGQVAETTPINITYTVGESDLKSAQKTGDYKAGKPNPFEAQAQTNNNTTSNGNTGNTNTNGSNTNTNSSQNGDSSNTSQYYPPSGTK